MKNRTSTFSSYLLSISKFVMIDWFTKSQHSLRDFVFEHVQNDGGRYGKKHSRYIEGYSQGFNHIEFPWGSPGSWHEQRNVANKPKFFLSGTRAVARLFPGTFTRTTAASTSRPAKSKKRQHDSTSLRDSGFFLKDVMLLPSPRIKKIPFGKLRESLHIEGYAASAVEFCSDWSERKLPSALEAVFKDKLDGLPAPMWV